jgi:hypothetical protein
MGKDNGVALAAIRDAAARHGVASRVHYEGAFSSVRDGTGAIVDAGWSRMRELLSRARLAANPWPLGGGSARIEAYAAGLPCPGIRLSFEESAWNRPQLVVCDVPAIHVPSGTAWTAEQYRGLCLRALHDATYFERIVTEQRQVVTRLTDAHRWWEQAIHAYLQWRPA